MRVFIFSNLLPKFPYKSIIKTGFLEKQDQGSRIRDQRSVENISTASNKLPLRESEPRGGYSHTLHIRVCAAQRGRDFEAPDFERGIHFRGVF